MTRGATERPKQRTDLRSTYRSYEWRSFPRATLLSARRYSVFVKFMKGALSMAAAGLAIAVLVYPLQPREPGRLAMTFGRLSRIDGDLAMVKPAVSGMDNDSMPFVVTASRARP